MDFGTEGLLDTLDALDAAGVRYAGAGRDAAEASKPLIVEANGLRVAFAGFVATPDEGGGFSIRQWAPGANAPGLAIGTPDAVRAAVAAAREQAHFVIVAIHAGDEYSPPPNATQVALANAAAAAGADAVIGAHAHVVQPIERIGGMLVAWGLGNFVFDLDDVDLANIPVPRVSLVLRLTLTEGKGVTSFEAIPVVLDASEDRPRPASPEEGALLFAAIAPR
jgi:poly-gamma-glutamate synthesis protein (capsule biosynthesis protein)